jgi:two-component system chemotaxis sensor kinase CheA
MSIDMRQFHAVFFEESQEHLDEMEQLLLALDITTPDAEMLNSIFRAAHSIKGGSGIFGFEALASATHILEGLLDKIRKGQLIITAPMVDIFLLAVDQLKDILDVYRSGEAVDSSIVQQLTQQLEVITPGSARVTILADKPLSSDGEGFGFFFEDSEPESSETKTTEKEPTITNDDGFGFFDDPIIPEPTNDNSNEILGFVDSLLATGEDEDEGFGFFTESEQISETSPQAEAKPSPKPESTSEPVSAVTPHYQQYQETSSAKSPAAPETIVAKPKTPDSGAAENSSIRVDVAKVDQLINLVGEIVITQSMMTLLGQSLEGAVAEKFQTIANELERNTREIQEAVMSIRMLPISFVFNRFPRVVRDLSTKLGKQIELVIEGGDTELDKGLTEKLVDPLTHLVRNSIDHGIESAPLRQARGKNPVGKVTLRAAQQGGNIVISISDDGGGLSREHILAKARENGIAVSDNPKDEEVWQLIFAPGFSTAEAVTDISGRGVGMDVVKRNVQSLGGRIHIESQIGQGATFTIHLPLTLAIVDGMCVSVGEQTFIIPLVHIVESMQPAQQDIKSLASDDQLLQVRNEYWPILRLHKLMQVEPHCQEFSQGIVVLVEAAKHRFALFVDSLVGQQQVVIKSLEQHYKRVAGVAGATILGDGSVALILDIESLALSVNQSASLAVVS